MKKVNKAFASAGAFFVRKAARAEPGRMPDWDLQRKEGVAFEIFDFEFPKSARNISKVALNLVKSALNVLKSALKKLKMALKKLLIILINPYFTYILRIIDSNLVPLVPIFYYSSRARGAFRFCR